MIEHNDGHDAFDVATISGVESDKVTMVSTGSGGFSGASIMCPKDSDADNIKCSIDVSGFTDMLYKTSITSVHSHAGVDITCEAADDCTYDQMCMECGQSICQAQDCYDATLDTCTLEYDSSSTEGGYKCIDTDSLCHPGTNKPIFISSDTISRTEEDDREMFLTPFEGSSTNVGVLANMVTTKGNDPSSVRIHLVSNAWFNAYVQEEQSGGDTEMDHVNPEDISYLAFDIGTMGFLLFDTDRYQIG